MEKSRKPKQARTTKRARHKVKPESEVADTRRPFVEDDEDTTASAEVERRGRHGNRWTEREYDVPSDDGRGRRIIVIRRERGSFERADSGGDFGGGLFGGIFRFGN